MADVLNTQDATLSARAGSLGGTSMRYHELALQHWLNKLFIVREGYPVPVVFTNPMDAFSHFSTLWADENNPFRYLLDAKDEKGTPLYEPYPSPVRYPIISVHRKGWRYRSYQNFSQHRFRKINWPTVSDAGSNIPGKPNVGSGLGKCQLGNVTTSRMPTAWDYRFQVDHFCLRPDTQAFYIEQLMDEFWRQGGNPQTWILVPYPGWGEKLVRLYIEGDIESLSPEEPEEGKNVEYRTSYTVVVEGFDVDLRYKIFPAFWTLIFQSGDVAVPPAIVDEAFSIITTEDVRIRDANPTLNTRPNVPPPCLDLIPDWKASRETLVLSLGGNITNVSDPDTFGPFFVYKSSSIPYAVVDLSGSPSSSGLVTAFLNGTLTDTSVSVDLSGNPDVAGLATAFFNGTLYTEGGTISSVDLSGSPSVAGLVTVFLSGTLLDVSSVSAGTFGPDICLSTTGFVYGSCDTFVHTEAATGSVSFRSGSAAETAIGSGTYFAQGTQVSAFYSGTLADAIQWSYGTEYASGSVAFMTGTLALIVISAGTFFNSGTTIATFGTGVLFNAIGSAGTWFDNATAVVGFRSGVLA